MVLWSVGLTSQYHHFLAWWSCTGNSLSMNLVSASEDEIKVCCGEILQATGSGAHLSSSISKYHSGCVGLSFMTRT